MTLDAKPQGGRLAWPVADDLLVFESKLFSGHIEVSASHEPRKGHTDLQVKLLSGVHAHRLVLVRMAQVVVGVG